MLFEGPQPPRVAPNFDLELFGEFKTGAAKMLFGGPNDLLTKVPFGQGNS